MKPGVFVGFGVLLALGAALYLVFSDGEVVDPVEVPVSGDAVERVTEDDGPRIADVAPAPSSAGKREAVVPNARPGVAAETTMPERYRRALGTITGRVVEASGEPVGDVPVALYRFQRTDFATDVGSLFDGGPAPRVAARHGETVTDDAGRFQFTGVFPESFAALGIDVHGPRATARFVDHLPSAGETVDLGDVTLERSVTFKGVVEDLDGEPVPNALVRATNLPRLIFDFGAAYARRDASFVVKEWRAETWDVYEPRPWMRELFDDLPIPQTRTDDEGAFVLEAVPVGLGSIVVQKEGYVSRVHGPVPTGESGERDVGTIRVDHGDEIAGRVVDASGAPVAGVRVLAGPMLMGEVGLVWPLGVTGSDGRFAAEGFDDKPHFVCARADDAIDWKVLEGVQAGFGELAVMLDPAYDLTISVVDAAGKVVADPTLLLRPTFDPADAPVAFSPIPLADRLERNDDGTFVVRDLGARKYNVLARADGFAFARAEADLTAGPARAQLVLSPERTLDVRVMDGTTGEPLEWVNVSAHRGDEWIRDDFFPLVSRRSDEDGMATLPGLRDGTYSIRAEHPDFSPAATPAELPMDGPVELELRPGGTIVGRVHQGGRPPDVPRFLMLDQSGDEIPRFVVTDLEGKFRVTRLRPGTVRIEVFRRFANQAPNTYVENAMRNVNAERRARVEVVEGQESTVDIDLLGLGFDGPSARLSGSVERNGAPLVAASVSVRPESDWEQSRAVSTDANGRFDFGLVPAGVLWVHLEPGSDSGRNFGGGIQQRIELAENESRELRFEFRTGRLVGRVETADGGVVAGAAIWASSVAAQGEEQVEPPQRIGLTASTDASGEFTFDSIPAGSFILSVHAEGFARASHGPVQVSENVAPPPVVIQITKGVEVSGTIRFPADHASAYLWIWAQAKDGGGYGDGAEIDEKTGKFTFKNLSPGEYQIMIAAERAYAPHDIRVPDAGLRDIVIDAVPMAVATPEEGGG